jgi:hypothetical protein
VPARAAPQVAVAAQRTGLSSWVTEDSLSSRGAARVNPAYQRPRTGSFPMQW